MNTNIWINFQFCIGAPLRSSVIANLAQKYPDFVYFVYFVLFTFSADRTLTKSKNIAMIRTAIVNKPNIAT